MTNLRSKRVAGAILCGGRASRLDGEKAFIRFGDTSLIETVIARFRSQADALVLSVQAESPRLAALGLPMLPDAVQRHRGPLAGLYTALKYARDEGFEWLALCPCDAPFLPADLVSVFSEAAEATGTPVIAAVYDDVVQPTFSYWSTGITDLVGEVVLEKGGGGLMFMLDRLDHSVVAWPESTPPPFFNINTPADLAEAERLLDAG